jgi:uncharacterized membrane protein
MQEQRVARPSTGRNDRDAVARQADLVISKVLRGGVLSSASIIVVGVVTFYVRYALYGADTHPFPHSFGAVITGIVHGDARSVIVLGLLVLLITPVLRVAVSILAFALERDWRYVVITSIVLCVLVLSFFLGRGGA